MRCTDSCCRPYDEDVSDAKRIGERVQRARKEYRCDDCPNPITVGSVYWRRFWIVDGEPLTVRSHTPVGACAWDEVES